MGFEWVPFLQRLGIEYVERGSNVARGYVNIQCPWCGDNDPSHHLGVPLDATRHWGCWRDPAHRGRNPVRLIRALAKCSWEEAQRIAGQGAKQNAEDFDVLLQKLGAQENPSSPLAPEVRLPAEFNSIARDDRFGRYLRGRGFDDPEAVAREYGLKGCYNGEFAWRLILPFELRGKLVGWTGRAIAPATIRYKTFPPGDSTVRHVLFNGDRAAGRAKRRLLLVCEGPMDALKVDWFGRERGIAGVALLGVSLSEERALRLAEIVEEYDRLGILLDGDAQDKAFRCAEQLSWLPRRPEVLSLPARVKDPGDLAPAQVMALG